MTDDIHGLDRLLKRLGDLAIDTHQVEKPLKVAGVHMLGSVEKNFQEQGRPSRWTPLSPRTIAGRRKGKNRSKSPRILIDMGRLKGSISFRLIATGPAVQVGTNVIYARRQHFGYPGGEGRGKAKTPARPFLLMQSDDVREISEIFRRHIQKH